MPLIRDNRIAKNSELSPETSRRRWAAVAARTRIVQTPLPWKVRSRKCEISRFNLVIKKLSKPNQYGVENRIRAKAVVHRCNLRNQTDRKEFKKRVSCQASPSQASLICSSRTSSRESSHNSSASRSRTKRWRTMTRRKKIATTARILKLAVRKSKRERFAAKVVLTMVQ